MDFQSLQCPSARCEKGATLIGVVQADGTIAYLPQPLPVEEVFVEAASRGRAPEKRFRFSSQCLETGCGQWTGTRCGVIDKAMQLMSVPSRAEPLPRCSVRRLCRWFKQSGASACGACKYIITDLAETEPATPASRDHLPMPSEPRGYEYDVLQST